MRGAVVAAVLVVSAAMALAQNKASEPKPPKADLPYLLKATKLIATEPQTLNRSGPKSDETISVSGVTSPARTPLPEPIFLFSPGEIKAGDFELIRFQVGNGHRRWKKGQQSSADDEPEEPLPLTLRPVAKGVIRIEAAVMLNPGEYALIPRGKNTAFCFTVF
jgi:hypothetical protein